ncbi:MAG: flavodoxin family protein [Actinomycetia bacterium]|nr:flavodoxin family protein [Actinomycetes bacterium]
MKKTIVAIYGSPRKRGNTEKLMDSFLAGTKSGPAGNNLHIEKVAAARLNISPCRGCRNCSRTGQCIIEDDMQDVYGLLEKADLVAVASPIFFTTVSGYLKAVVDRCQRYWSLKYELKRRIIHKERQGIFFSCAGSDSDSIFDCARKVIRSFFDVLYINYHSDYVFNQIDELGDIDKHPRALNQVYEWGKSKQFYDLLKVGEK